MANKEKFKLMLQAKIDKINEYKTELGESRYANFVFTKKYEKNF